MSDLEKLSKEVEITEERQQALDLMRRRLVVDHSLTLHRDSTSVRDIKKMIEAMEAAGMPETATLKVDGTDNHTRMHARWSTEPKRETVAEVRPPNGWKWRDPLGNLIPEGTTHVLAQDGNGDPTCVCGFKALAATQIGAASIIEGHVKAMRND